MNVISCFATHIDEIGDRYTQASRQFAQRRNTWVSAALFDLNEHSFTDTAPSGEIVERNLPYFAQHRETIRNRSVYLLRCIIDH